MAKGSERPSACDRRGVSIDRTRPATDQYELGFSLRSQGFWQMRKISGDSGAILGSPMRVDELPRARRTDTTRERTCASRFSTVQQCPREAMQVLALALACRNRPNELRRSRAPRPPHRIPKKHEWNRAIVLGSRFGAAINARESTPNTGPVNCILSRRGVGRKCCRGSETPLMLPSVG